MMLNRQVPNNPSFNPYAYGYGPEAQFFHQQQFEGPEFAPAAPVAPMPLPSEVSKDTEKQNKIDQYGALGGLAGGFLAPKIASAFRPDGAGKGGMLESLSGVGDMQLAGIGGAGAGLGKLAGGMLGGADFEDVAAESLGTGIGTFAGGALGSFLGPVGTMAGSAIGGFLGDKVGGFIDDKIFDRVICSTLWQEGYLTRPEVVVDLMFTKYRLTPTHVVGYHLWARPVATAIRRGRWCRTWQFIARRRSRELSYQLGYSTRPDYIGKVIRHVMEPACYTLGKLKELHDAWRTADDTRRDHDGTGGTSRHGGTFVGAYGRTPVAWRGKQRPVSGHASRATGHADS